MDPQPRLSRVDRHDRRLAAQLDPAPAAATGSGHRQGVLPAHVAGLAPLQAVLPHHPLVTAAEQHDLGGSGRTGRGLKAIHRAVVQRLGGQQVAGGIAGEPADHLPGDGRPFDEIGITVAVEVGELPVDPTAGFAGRDPLRPARALQGQPLDALLAAHEQLMPPTRQIPDQQAPPPTGRLAGQQIPAAGLLPRPAGVDALAGRLRVDRDSVGRAREHEQFGLAVAIDVVGHGIERELVDRDLAPRPVGRQRQFVGPIRVGHVLAGAFRGGQPAIDVEACLPRVDHDDVVAAVAAQVGHEHAFRPTVELDHPHALPAVERPRGRQACRGRGDDQYPEDSRHRARDRHVLSRGRHAGENTPAARGMPRADDSPAPLPAHSGGTLIQARASWPRRQPPRAAFRAPWPRSAGPVPWSRPGLSRPP